MKRWLWAVVVLLMVAAGIFLGCRKSGRGDDDDACVKAAATTFTDPDNGLRGFLDRVEHQKTQRNMRRERAPSPLAIVREANEERGEFACLFPPLSITDSDIQVYPRKRVQNCPVDQHLLHVSDDFKKKFRAVADSVGQLLIVNSSYSTSTFWGTGFVISQNYVATTCHLVDPLLKDNMLELGDKEKMVIEFRNPTRQCQIDPASITCSPHVGLDVALLKVVNNSCITTGPMPKPSSLPTPVTLDAGEPSDLQDKPLVVIGYGDLDHPVDADTDDLYSVFKGYGTNKFLMLDLAPAVENCGGDKGQLNILLDAASTTVGESGGVLVKAGKFAKGPNFLESLATDGSPVAVVGVHTCCTTFFAGQEKGTPPEPYKSCAKVKRTFDNQDVSIKSVLDDATLCAVLKQDGVTCSGSKR